MRERERQRLEPIAPAASALIVEAERIALEGVTADPDSDALALDIAAALLFPTPQREGWDQFVKAARARLDDDRALPLVAHVGRFEIHAFDDLCDPGNASEPGSGGLGRLWLSGRRERIAARSGLAELMRREARGEAVDTDLAAQLDDRRVRLDGQLEALWRAVRPSTSRPSITRMRLAGVERKLVDTLLDPAAQAGTAARVATALGHIWQPFTQREVELVVGMAAAHRDAEVTNALLECLRGESPPLLNDHTGERLALLVADALAGCDATVALARARVTGVLGCARALPGWVVAGLFECAHGSDTDENLCIDLAYAWLTQHDRRITPFLPAVLRTLESRARPWPSSTWYWLGLWLAPWEANAWAALASDALADLMQSTPIETAAGISTYSPWSESESRPARVPPRAAWDATMPWHQRLAVRKCWKGPNVGWGRSLGAVAFGLTGLAEMGGPWERVLVRAWGEGSSAQAPEGPAT